MNVYRYFAVRPLSALLALVTLVNNPAWSVQTMMPGQYQMVVRINKNELREQNITFMLLEDDPNASVGAGKQRLAMATIRLTDGSAPPFGATVVNKKRYQTGIVNDNGSVWIIGIKPGETMQCTYFGMAKRSVPFLCPNGYRR